MHPARPLIALLLLVVPLPAPAAEPGTAVGPDAGADRPRIALVLSGGGARGAAHVGVMKVLEEARVPVDFIVGTSGGAVTGGLYASGLSPDELETWLADMDWDKALSDEPPRDRLSFRRKEDDARFQLELELGYEDGRFRLPQALIAGRNLDYLLKTTTLHVEDVRDFDRLPVPFRAVATDIETGEPYLLDHGSLATALRASMSVPGLFAPVEHHGRLLVDGGLVANLPVQVARELGADVVIAVDVGSNLLSREQLGNLLGVSQQVLNVLMKQNVEASLRRLTDDDVLVRPALGDIAGSDFQRSPEAIRLGEKAAREMIDRLKRFSVSEARYRDYLERQRAEAFEPPRLDFIDIVGNPRVSTDMIRARMTLRPGDRLDLEQLESDLDEILTIGEIQSVDFEIVRSENRTGLRVRVQEKGWGPNYFRFGMNISDDFAGGSEYNILVGHTRPYLNDLGAEWKNEIRIGETQRFFSEFFQPLEYRGRYFISPQIELESHSFNLFDDTSRTAEYRAKSIFAMLDVGYLASSYGELRLGVYRGQRSTEPRIGPSDAPSFRYDEGGYRLEMTADRLNRAGFPSDGYYAHLDASSSSETFNSERLYDRAELETAYAGSAGSGTWLFGTRFGTAFRSTLPLAREFTLGGFMNLSGLRQEQLRGQHMAFARGVYLHRIGTLTEVTGSAMYIGASLETGNTWTTRDDISANDLRYGSSLFFGVDSILGPIYLGVGYADEGEGAVYLSLGRRF